MQLLVAARQLSGHPLDRQRRTVDLAEIPDLTLATDIGDRYRMLLLRRVKPDERFAILLHGPPSVHEARLGPPSNPHMTRAWSRGRITGTSKGLQLLRYPRSKPICATRPVSEHDQPHMRSPLIAAAPRSRFRRAGLREDENHSRKRHFRPWLATVRLPGSARTDQVLGDDGITLVYSLGNLHRNAFDNDTGGHVFPERDQ